jgi:AMMECR1 domain-containing protein
LRVLAVVGLRIGLAVVAVTSFGIAHASNYDEHRLLELARQSVVSEVRGTPLEHVQRGTLPVQPVFITIEVKGQIRGCRGSLTTRATSLEDEIRLAARAAAAHDPRYKPLTEQESRDFKLTVTIVERQDPISTEVGLQPAEGLALESGGRWGIVLPWEGKDPAVRLKWAYQKAGVPIGSAATMFRLVATRFRG